jgi:hypothetical protein
LTGVGGRHGPDDAVPTADPPVRLLGPTKRRKVDLSGVKGEARRSLAPDGIGRELVLALPDRMNDYALDALFPTLVRELRERAREGRP